jgi:hypothetical protein
VGRQSNVERNKRSHHPPPVLIAASATIAMLMQ